MRLIDLTRINQMVDDILNKINAKYATKAELDSGLKGKAEVNHGMHLTLGNTQNSAYRGDYGNAAYQHSKANHAPSDAQKNSDITKAEIEAKLTGSISSHKHDIYALNDHGIHVPESNKEDQGKFLSSDNTWKFPPVTVIPESSTNAPGIVQLNNNINSTDTTQAATANAVRIAHEKGTEALGQANEALEQVSEVFNKANEALDQANAALNKANEAFQSANNGKQLIANAIGDESINKDSTFEAMSNAIKDKLNALDSTIRDLNNLLEGKINPAGTALDTDVLSGKTFINSTGNVITGTIPDRGPGVTIIPTTIDQVKDKGYYSGPITVKGDSNLKPSNILSGKNIFGITGTGKTSSFVNIFDKNNPQSELFVSGFSCSSEEGVDARFINTTQGIYVYASSYYSNNIRLLSKKTYDFTNYSLIRFKVDELNGWDASCKLGVRVGNVNTYMPISHSPYIEEKWIYADITNVNGVGRIFIGPSYSSNNNYVQLKISQIELIIM